MLPASLNSPRCLCNFLQGVVEAVDPVRTTIIDDERNPSEAVLLSAPATAITCPASLRISCNMEANTACSQSRRAYAFLATPAFPLCRVYFDCAAVYMSNTEVTACVIRNLTQGQARRQAA